MIRILLLGLFIALLAGGAFLYFWDIPVQQEQVERRVEESILRD